MKNKLSEEILNVIKNAEDPLETKEVTGLLDRENATRTKVIERLKDLRGERKIEGKRVGPGKGVWIWWK